MPCEFVVVLSEVFLNRFSYTCEILIINSHHCESEYSNTSEQYSIGTYLKEIDLIDITYLHDLKTMEINNLIL